MSKCRFFGLFFRLTGLISGGEKHKNLYVFHQSSQMILSYRKVWELLVQLVDVGERTEMSPEREAGVGGCCFIIMDFQALYTICFFHFS